MTRNSNQPDIREWRARGSMVVGYFALVVLIAGFGSWSVTSKISGAVIVPGQIEVEQNRQVVQHPNGGVVGKILVSEGSVVEAGEVLIRLDDALVQSELTVIESQYFEMVARRGRLEAERDEAEIISFDDGLISAGTANSDVAKLIAGQERLFTARLGSQRRETDQLAEQNKQIAAQIDGLAAQYDAQVKQIELIRLELEDQKKLLAKGLAQTSRVLTLQREVARMEGLLGEIRSSKAQAAARLIEAGIGILRLGNLRREEAITRLRDLQYREIELFEKRALLTNTLSGLDIRAPTSGAVYGLQVHALRSVIRPADPVMFIVPQDRPLVVTSRIEPIHIDQVFVGQEVTLRFSGFDQRTTPELSGKIVKLSADAFVDEATRASYYRAEIVLSSEELEKLNGLELLPGMPVESFIRTQDRTPLNYLLKPLADYFNKSFREG
ncbi:MAG: HlyD family type I secretion membrane fusion protein [Paracoccaceae bacterium]|jgi:HlyD family type I secretion membrane fusion protein